MEGSPALAHHRPRSAKVKAVSAVSAQSLYRHDHASHRQAARHPGGRIGQAEEIAEAVALHFENAFISGETLHVDGAIRLV